MRKSDAIQDRPAANQTVEEYMPLPPWLTAMRDAMTAAVTPDVLTAVIKAQVRKAVEGDTRAAKFVTDQAHQLLAAEQRRPISITQNNMYLAAGSAPIESPVNEEPHTRKSLDVAAARVARGLPARLRGDRRVAEHLRADDDETEKRKHREEADAERAAEEAL